MEIRAKKSLGQNFLKSKAALAHIIKAGEINDTDIVLEVGPGKGVLTDGLLQKSKEVIAIEKDDRLIELLNEKFQPEIASRKLKILHQDVLDFNPISLKAISYKLIANIPYYITGQLLRQFLESKTQPQKMVLMLQKEVAKRIVANDKKESILSLSVKAYGTPKYIETVPARYFAPAPKVDSAILLINNISKNFFTESNITEEKFFRVIKAGFAHKRKVLVQNLQKEFTKEKVVHAFFVHHLDSRVRSEDLSLNDWKLLTQSL
jgi:16S rRNA (adenine1518-N6/adenine1519-N6)-dimethyltransferase